AKPNSARILTKRRPAAPVRPPATIASNRNAWHRARGRRGGGLLASLFDDSFWQATTLHAVTTEGGMASKLKIKVNGLVHSVTASLDTPLLYVLHNELHLHGPRFGCGLAQCGACSVLLDGKEIRSCVTPVAAVSGKAITTLEGLPALWAKERGTAAASPALHPLQQSWIDV